MLKRYGTLYKKVPIYVEEQKYVKDSKCSGCDSCERIVATKFHGMLCMRCVNWFDNVGLDQAFKGDNIRL